MLDCFVSFSPFQGGGLYLSSGTCLLVDVLFSSNTASRYGNDVFVYTGSTLLIAEVSMSGASVMEYNDIYKVDASATIFKGCSAGYAGLLKVQSPNGASCDSESSGSIDTTGGYPYPDPNNCGQYKNQPCNFCSPCDDGMISLGAQTTCTLCPPGTYSNSDHTACLSCEIGSASLGGSANCSVCSDEGKYSDSPGSSFCKTAPAGHKPNAERTGLVECPSGFYSVGGSNECAACEAGKHSKERAVSCKYCPQYETYDETSKQCDCLANFTRGEDKKCTCSAGMTLDGERCVFCEKAKFKGGLGVKSCKLCEASLKGAITVEEGSITNSSCICPAGTFDNRFLDPRRCNNVPEGVSESTEGMTLETLTLEPGNWRTGPASLEIRPCHVDLACIGGNGTYGLNGTAYCREGHHGPYCSICAHGFSVDAFGFCQNCDASSENKTFTIGTMAAAIVVLIAIKLCLKRERAAPDSGAHGVADNENYSARKPGFSKRLKNSAKVRAMCYQRYAQNALAMAWSDTSSPPDRYSSLLGK